MPEVSAGLTILSDLDRQYLFCPFNSIELARTSTDALKYLPVYFSQLFEYTKEHFSREAQIQLKVEYPSYSR